MEMNFTDEYEILTENGFKPFSGFKRTIAKTILLKFTDGSEISCTGNHLFKTNEGEFLRASEILEGTICSTGKIVHQILLNELEEYVFDALEVEDGHEYLTNGVTSHNCAFVENWEEFSSSVLPVLSSGETTKTILTSTPNGLNHFFDYCENAKAGVNGYAYLEVPWYMIPGRGEAWKKEIMDTINHNEDKFAQEYNCDFLSKGGTLISGATLKRLKHTLPIGKIGDDCIVYEHPIPERDYYMTVDVSRGKHLDYSVCMVFTKDGEFFKQVAMYRSNEVPPLKYSQFIVQMGKYYNNAFVLVEINDAGGQVADSLYFDFEYENVIKTVSNGRNGKIPTFAAPNAELGVRTTRQVKAIGCLHAKSLIERDQLRICDEQTISELRAFTQQGASYAADEGNHDDTVMCLVLFAWFADSVFFKGYFEVNAREALYKKYSEEENESVIPLPMYDSGLGDGNGGFSIF